MENINIISININKKWANNQTDPNDADILKKQQKIDMFKNTKNIKKNKKQVKFVKQKKN